MKQTAAPSDSKYVLGKDSLDKRHYVLYYNLHRQVILNIIQIKGGQFSTKKATMSTPIIFSRVAKSLAVYALVGRGMLQLQGC